jgi:hypothetical protein
MADGRERQQGMAQTVDQVAHARGHYTGPRGRRGCGLVPGGAQDPAVPSIFSSDVQEIWPGMFALVYTISNGDGGVPTATLAFAGQDSPQGTEPGWSHEPAWKPACCGLLQAGRTEQDAGCDEPEVLPDLVVGDG